MLRCATILSLEALAPSTARASGGLPPFSIPASLSISDSLFSTFTREREREERVEERGMEGGVQGKNDR